MLYIDGWGGHALAVPLSTNKLQVGPSSFESLRLEEDAFQHKSTMIVQ